LQTTLFTTDPAEAPQIAALPDASTPHPCWEKPVRKFGIFLGRSAQHAFRCQGSTAMTAWTPANGSTTIAVGVWLQAEVHGAQHHNRRQHPPSPASALQGGGCCLVHDATGERTELGWRRAAAPSLWLRSEAVQKSSPI